MELVAKIRIIEIIRIKAEGDKRVFGPVVHFDIQDGKIWIQYNGTEDSIAERLVEMGVPTSDIVLGFDSSCKRQFTPYAVG